MKKERKLTSKQVYKGKILDLYVDQVLTPDGVETTREVIRHCAAAAILAKNKEGRFLFEKQYRYPFDDFVLEVPAGKADPGEDPLECAKREFEEETGLKAKKWTFLGEFYPSVAYTDEVISLFYAEDLCEGNRHLDADENLDVFTLGFEEMKEKMRQGEFKDGKTLAAIGYYLLSLMK